MKKHYIKAMASLLTSGQSVDVVLAKLEALLKEKGHLSIHKDILEGLLVELSQETASSAAVVSIARESDAKKLENAIHHALLKLGDKNATMKLVVDETLIGGFKINHQGKAIDASYKNRLLELYRNIIK